MLKQRVDTPELRAAARRIGLLGAVVAVGVILMWPALLHAQPCGPSIAALLEAKAQRTPAQRKLSSHLLGAVPPADDVTRPQAPPTDATDAEVTVDIRADVTPAALARIRTLGGTVINSVSKYRAIRARLPLTALEPLARLNAVQFIRPADQAITHEVLAPIPESSEGQ